MLPGQAGTNVLLGRRAAYGGPFGAISTLSVGDEITLTTGQGAHTYRVSGVRRAGAPQPKELAKGEGRLTLVTADGPEFLPEDILRVDAKLTSQAVPSNGAPPSMAVPDAEQPMAIDSGALVGLVGWGLVLCAGVAGVVYLRQRAGRRHAWVVGVPLLGALGLTVADLVEHSLIKAGLWKKSATGSASQAAPCLVGNNNACASRALWLCGPAFC